MNESRRRVVGLFLFLLSIAFGPQAFAFPEFVRHGYVNCNSCHVSPSGGGILTDYGRQISTELLSSWGKEGEGAFVYGLVKPPEPLNLAGFYKSVYTYVDTPLIREGKYIFMQGDLEAAIDLKKFYVDGTIGYQAANNVNPALTDYLISRRHYAGYRFTDEIQIRGGKFLMDYGINTPDHVISTKQGLGFDEGTETYNLEASYSGETYSLFLTGNFGRIDQSNSQLEQGFCLNGGRAISDHYKVGVSYFYGTLNNAHRNLIGPYGILGFTPHFFLLSEIDFVRSDPGTVAGIWGLAESQRLDYEWFQGFHTFFDQYTLRRNFGDVSTLSDNWGLGLQFFPRSHVEFDLEWTKTRVASNDFTDMAWLMFSYYL
jgi:hypothetical protein